jgi:hypothetical protein
MTSSRAVRRLIPLAVLASVAFCALPASAMAMNIYLKIYKGRTVSEGSAPVMQRSNLSFALPGWRVIASLVVDSLENAISTRGHHETRVHSAEAVNSASRAEYRCRPSAPDRPKS